MAAFDYKRRLRAPAIWNMSVNDLSIRARLAMKILDQTISAEERAEYDERMSRMPRSKKAFQYMPIDVIKLRLDHLVRKSKVRSSDDEEEMIKIRRYLATYKNTEQGKSLRNMHYNSQKGDRRYEARVKKALAAGQPAPERKVRRPYKPRSRPTFAMVVLKTQGHVEAGAAAVPAPQPVARPVPVVAMPVAFAPSASSAFQVVGKRP